MLTVSLIGSYLEYMKNPKQTPKEKSSHPICKCFNDFHCLRVLLLWKDTVTTATPLKENISLGLLRGSEVSPIMSRWAAWQLAGRHGEVLRVLHLDGRAAEERALGSGVSISGPEAQPRRHTSSNKSLFHLSQYFQTVPLTVSLCKPLSFKPPLKKKIDNFYKKKQNDQ